MEYLIKKCSKILKKISKQFEISYGLIFGSVVSGYRRKDSDLDIAVKLEKTPSCFEEELRIITKIAEVFEKELQIETDVIILNCVSSGLRYEIFATGKLLYSKNFQKYIEEKSEIINKFLDFKHILENHYKKIVKEIAYG